MAKITPLKKANGEQFSPGTPYYFDILQSDDLVSPYEVKLKIQTICRVNGISTIHIRQRTEWTKKIIQNRDVIITDRRGGFRFHIKDENLCMEIMLRL
jgi:hypothetical protein